MDTDDTAMSAESPDTEVVPGSTETERVELAWSAESGMPDTLAENRRPLSRSLVGLLVAVGVSAVGLGAFVFGRHEPLNDAAPPPSTSVAPAPQPKPAPPVAGPAPPAQPTTSSATPAPPPPPTIAASTPAPLTSGPVPAASVPGPRILRDDETPSTMSGGLPYDISDQRGVCNYLTTHTKDATGGIEALAVMAEQQGMGPEESQRIIQQAVNNICPWNQATFAEHVMTNTSNF